MSWLVHLLFLTVVLGVQANQISREESVPLAERFLLEPNTQAPPTGLAFASYYGNHMVLQRAPHRATIWGYASKLGDTISLTLSGKGNFTTIVKEGPEPNRPVWSLQLPAVKEGGPYTISVQSSEGHLKLRDVMFGDVWLCSGQSNMAFTLNKVSNASAEMADVNNYPDVRIFTVPPKGSASNQFELLKGIRPWSVPHYDASKPNHPFTFSAVCWLYGKYLYKTLKYPIGLVSTSYGGTPVEAWSSPDVLNKCYSHRNQVAQGSHVNPHSDSVLWNAMIHPLLNLTIYGAIWYQGESNSGAATVNAYNCTFPAMIDDWRVKFHEASQGQTDSKFPFGFVQLAGSRNLPTVSVGFPDVRWHQTADYGYVPNARMENTFMAVAMDLPDFDSPFGSIHPRDKQDVAQRLTLSGLAVAYNKTDVKFQGPWPEKVIAVAGQPKVDIVYKYAENGLDVRSKNGFEVCCAQTCPKSGGYPWYPGTITKTAHNTVEVTYGQPCQGSSPTAIRYAWRLSPCPFKQCAIYGKDTELPAPPFYMKLGQ